jgi:hypothetical protein
MRDAKIFQVIIQCYSMQIMQEWREFESPVLEVVLTLSYFVNLADLRRNCTNSENDN